MIKFEINNITKKAQRGLALMTLIQSGIFKPSKVKNLEEQLIEVRTGERKEG